MKGVVVRDVGHFAFRPRIGLRAQYTAVTFLSQITFSHRARGARRARALALLSLRSVSALSPRSCGDRDGRAYAFHPRLPPAGERPGRGADARGAVLRSLPGPPRAGAAGARQGTLLACAPETRK